MRAGLSLLLPPLDARLALEIERIGRLEAKGELSQAEAERLLDRAHDALEAELDRREAPKTRFDCVECGGVGSRPTHRRDCVFWRPFRRPQ